MENSLLSSISGRMCGFQKAVQKNVHIKSQVYA